MSGPSVDLEKPNLIGGLDKLVTNFAIAAIAVIPTLWTCIVKPWRLRPLLNRDEPDGRMGMLLAPGAFFPLALMVSFLIAALLATPETVSNNDSFIGPGLAVSVQTAASEGDIWKMIAIIMPIYGTAVLMGLLGVFLKPWTQQDWNLRVSLRAAFYLNGVVISWMILTSAVMELARVSLGSYELFSFLLPVFIILTIGFVLWIYFWFFRNEESVSKIRSGALSLTMLGLIITVFVAIDLLIRMT